MKTKSNILSINKRYLSFKENMVKFHRLSVSHHDPARYYGISLEVHPKGKTLDIYLGKHMLVFRTGRSY